MQRGKHAACGLHRVQAFLDVALQDSVGADFHKNAATLGSRLGLPLALFASNRWDWHAPFYLMVALGAVGGLLVKKLGWELPDTVRPIAWALIIGAFWMVIAETRVPSSDSIASIRLQP